MDNVILYIDSVEELEKLNEEEIYQEIIIKNVTIDEEILRCINDREIDILRLNNCYIKENEELYKLNVKELDLTDSVVEDILFVNNMSRLDTLILDNIKEIDLKDISIIKYLKSFSINNVKILNEDKLFYLGNVEMLRIDGTNIQDLSILLSFENLKYLVVDMEQVDKFNDVLKELCKKGIKVVDYRNHMVIQ